MFSIGLLKYKNFRNLFVASTISEFGSFITDTALMLYIFTLTNESKSWLGISKATFISAYTLGTLVGGGLQKFSQFKKILLFSSIIRVPLIILMIQTDSPSKLVIYSGGIAFFQGIFTPLRRALTNIFVPTNQIQSANSLVGTSYAALHLICPYIGATLFTMFSEIKPVLLIDLSTYLIAFLLILFINDLKDFKESSNDQSFKIDFKFFKNYPHISTMSLHYSILGVLVGILIPLLLPFTLQVLDASKQDYGIIMLSFGSGGLIGGLLSNKASTIIPSNRLSLYCFFMEIFMFFIWSRFSNFYVSCFLLVLWGSFVFLRVPAQFNFISQTVPTKDLGIAHSFVQLSFVIPNFIGGIIVAFVGDSMGVKEIYNYSCVAFIMIALWRAFSGSTKNCLNSMLSK